MKENEELRQCRANILEIASALDAYKVSNDFIEVYYRNGSTGQLESHPLDVDMAKKYHLPQPNCPLGPVGKYLPSDAQSFTKPNDPTPRIRVDEIGREWYVSNWKRWMNTSYAITTNNENYTINCMLHNTNLLSDKARAYRLTLYSTLQHGFQEDM